MLNIAAVPLALQSHTLHYLVQVAPHLTYIDPSVIFYGQSQISQTNWLIGHSDHYSSTTPVESPIPRTGLDSPSIPRAEVGQSSVLIIAVLQALHSHILQQQFQVAPHPQGQSLISQRLAW